MSSHILNCFLKCSTMDRLLDRQKDEGQSEDFMLEHFHYPSATFDTSS